MTQKYDLVIFDVDGTLVKTKSGKQFRENAADWEFLPGRLEKCLELAEQGVKLGIASNQGGVAFGLLDVHEIRQELYNVGKAIHANMVEMCFHHPKAKIALWKEDSSRRKPGPGMLEYIISRELVAKSQTLMVGDRHEDEQAATAAGVDFQWADEFFA